MKELIEKLKDKNYVRAFGLMKPEEQKCLKEANGKNGVIVLLNSGWEPGNMAFDCPNLTYCIKPDYKPEPEFVDLEIHETEDSRYAELRSLQADYKGYSLDIADLVSLPDFVGFHYDEETAVGLEDVANLMDKKDTVYARFRS